MRFNINSIPTAVRELFINSSLMSAVKAAASFGITSSDTLTDIVFFLRHPERAGKKLAASEKLLIQEWVDLQLEINRVLTSIAEFDPPTGSGPLWLKYADQERKRWSSIKESATDMDEKYFQASPFWGNKRHADGAAAKTGSNIHWCAAFVNWCLHRSGYSHTGSGSNRSFQRRTNWHFNALEAPKKGCVILLGHSKNGNNSNHIGFLWSSKGLPEGSKNIGDVWVDGAKRLHLLGGNQGDQVQVKNFWKKKIYAAKGHNGVTSPYLWPLRGPDNCSISAVPTCHGHHCGKNPA